MKRRLEKGTEIFAWIISALLLVTFVPRNRIREAQVPFMFKQLITWLFGLFVVEKRFISYPSRLFFRRATKTSFTFEYFVYPAFCSLFNLYYPENRRKISKLLHYFFFTSIITVFEIFAEKYTSLIKYKKWTWYWSFITIWISYYMSHIYFKWFFKGKKSLKELSQI